MNGRPFLVLLQTAILNQAIFAAPPRTITVNPPATQPAAATSAEPTVAAAEPTAASASSLRSENVVNPQRKSDLSAAFDDQLRRLLSEQPTLSEADFALLAPEV